MPVDRLTRLSLSQFGELLGVEAERLIAVEVDRKSSTVTLVLEPLEYAPGIGDIAIPDATGHP